MKSLTTCRSLISTLSRFGCVLSLPVLLAACDVVSVTAVDSPAGVAMTPPAFLLQSRAIDRSALRPLVVLMPDGREIDMERVSDQGWAGSILVDTNSSVVLSITWLERIGDRELALAQLTQNIDVGETAERVNVNASDYDVSLDIDGDGVSNLRERELDTDPFDPDSFPLDGTEPSTPPDSTGGQDPEPDNPDGGPISTPGPVIDPGAGPDTPPGTTPDNAANPPFGNNPLQDNVEDAADVLIPRIAPDSAPSIDGLGVAFLNADGSLQDEWAPAGQSDTLGASLTINRLMIDNNADAADGAPHRRWAAMHDGEFLYVLVLVDDIGQRRSDSADISADDSVELYIDGDNSKNTSWGDDDDFHLRIPLLVRDTSNGNASETGRFDRGTNSSQDPFELRFATGPGIGPDGVRFAQFEQDVYELSIHLETAGIRIGDPFGIELQINDDDDGGERDAKWGWAHPPRTSADIDLTADNPSLMGTAILLE